MREVIQEVIHRRKSTCRALRWPKQTPQTPQTPQRVDLSIICLAAHLTSTWKLVTFEWASRLILRHKVVVPSRTGSP